MRPSPTADERPVLARNRTSQILDRVIADAGYPGHNAPPEHRFRAYTAGQKRRVTAQIKREFKRRRAGDRASQG